jgi:hypothetical protein
MQKFCKYTKLTNDLNQNPETYKKEKETLINIF